MSWATPKTDWAAGLIPTALDFNRIEGNILAAGRQDYFIPFSGSAVNAGEMASNATNIQGVFDLTIPGGFGLYLIRARFLLVEGSSTVSNDFTLQIDSSPAESEYISDSNRGDIDLTAAPYAIFENVAESSQPAYARIKIKNNNAGAKTLASFSGWSLLFGILEIPA